MIEVLSQDEMHKAIDRAGEITRWQMLAEFGELLKTDLAQARKQLLQVAEITDVTAMLSGRSADGTPESRFFSAALDLARSPDPGFTETDITWRMSEQGASPGDVRSAKSAVRTGSAGVGFGPAVLAQRKVHEASGQVEGAVRMGVTRTALDQAVELGHNDLRARHGVVDDFVKAGWGFTVMAAAAIAALAMASSAPLIFAGVGAAGALRGAWLLYRRHETAAPNRKAAQDAMVALRKPSDDVERAADKREGMSWTPAGTPTPEPPTRSR